MAVSAATLVDDYSARIHKPDQYYLCVRDGQLQVPLDRGLTRGEEWVFQIYEYQAFHPKHGDVHLGAFRHEDSCIFAKDDNSVELKEGPPSLDAPDDAWLFIINEWDPCYLESVAYEGRYLHFSKAERRLGLSTPHRRLDRTDSYTFNIQLLLSSRGTKVIGNKPSSNGATKEKKPGAKTYPAKTGTQENKPRMVKSIQLQEGPQPCLICVEIATD